MHEAFEQTLPELEAVWPCAVTLCGGSPCTKRCSLGSKLAHGLRACNVDVIGCLPGSGLAIHSNDRLNVSIDTSLSKVSARCCSRIGGLLSLAS